MQQGRDKKVLGGKVEGAMHHLRQSQKRWAAGDCLSLPLEIACLGSRRRMRCMMTQLEEGQRLRMLSCIVSMKSDMETTNDKDKLWV